MEIDRKQVMEWFLLNLYYISNKEFQIRVWIQGAGPECHDFDEAVNNFFEDCDPILAHYQAYGIAESQYQALKIFRDEFRIFADNNYSEFEFIDTPEWARIRSLAKDVLAAFDYQGSQDS